MVMGWMSVLSVGAQAAPRDWSFAVPRWAPCEDVGIRASFRVEAHGEVDARPGETQITGLSVRVVATIEGVTGSARLAIERDGAVIQSVPLAEPWYAMMSDGAPGFTRVLPPTADRSSTQGIVVTVPPGATARLSVSAVQVTPTGSCSLGNTEQVLSL